MYKFQPASMRPPTFAGGNQAIPWGEKTLFSQRFNEAADFCRRKLVAHWNRCAGTIVLQ